MLWWSISLEVILLLISFAGLISSILFIIVAISRCQFRPNLALVLAVNLSLGGLITCTSMFFQAIRMIMNASDDRLCPFLSYFFTLGGLYIFQAAALQSIYRLFVTVFLHQRRWRNRCLFLSLAVIQFLICSAALSPLLFTNRFPYHPATKVCYIAFDDIFGVLYPATCFYFIPLTFQALLSFWILRDVSRRMKAGRARLIAVRRIHKERRVLFRLALPVILLLSVGLIFFVFFFLVISTHGKWQAPAYALHLGSSVVQLLPRHRCLLTFFSTDKSNNVFGRFVNATRKFAHGILFTPSPKN